MGPKCSCLSLAGRRSSFSSTRSRSCNEELAHLFLVAGAKDILKMSNRAELLHGALAGSVRQMLGRPSFCISLTRANLSGFGGQLPQALKRFAGPCRDKTIAWGCQPEHRMFGHDCPRYLGAASRRACHARAFGLLKFGVRI